MTSDFTRDIEAANPEYGKRRPLEILQVNLGNVCNQRCIHCHVNAGPLGDKVMGRGVMDQILAFLDQAPGLTLDITGGCPEMNPHFTWFVNEARDRVNHMMVRSNLTILEEPGFERLAEFYRNLRLHLICSMPCYTPQNVDAQRGEGVFENSIRALRRLNALGYGREDDLLIDLVYNPGGDFLPGDQSGLETDYKRMLMDNHDVVFNRLLTITNAPINRFRQFLESSGRYDDYMRLLQENFNPQVAGAIMCRNLLSVGWDGILYDCDFNQALGLALRDADGKIMEIGSLKLSDLEDRAILFADHCYCCTAGTGSSCGGALDSAACATDPDGSAGARG
jgi:radical SAM/Cys-rich protein